MSALISIAEYYIDDELVKLSDCDKRDSLRELWSENPDGLDAEDYDLPFELLAEKRFVLWSKQE